MTGTDGTCDPRFDGVRRLLEQNLASGEELGASLAVDIDGHLAAKSRKSIEGSDSCATLNGCPVREYSSIERREPCDFGRNVI